MTELPPPADVESWDAAVVAVLERAERLTPAEATALDAAMRARPEVEPLAAQIVWAIEREVSFWATRADWETPLEQMAEARRRVAIALGDTGPCVRGRSSATTAALPGQRPQPPHARPLGVGPPPRQNSESRGIG